MILAVPVAAEQSASALREYADEVVVLSTPPWFFAIGEFYENFSQTTDEEVIALLDRYDGPPASSDRLSATTGGR